MIPLAGPMGRRNGSARGAAPCVGPWGLRANQSEGYQKMRTQTALANTPILSRLLVAAYAVDRKFERIVVPPWAAALGAPWTPLGASGAPLGCSAVLLGAPGAPLGAIGASLGAPLSHLGFL